MGKSWSGQVEKARRWLLRSRAWSDGIIPNPKLKLLDEVREGMPNRG